MTPNRFAIFQGEIVSIEMAQISIMSHIVNYGTGCFGGIRGYWNEGEQQLLVFRPLDHFKRLRQSARMLLIQLPLNEQQLTDQLLELIRREEYHQDVYARPLAFKNSPLIGVRLHNLEDAYACFAVPFGRYLEKEEGLRATVSSWRRIDDNVVPARGKIIGSYVNSAFAKSEAQLNGFDEAIVLTAGGHIAEGSAENIFLLRDGKLVTPPITDNILEGITRKTIIQLAKEQLGIDTVERSIDRSELYVADEAFFTGTGCQVAAIVEVDRRPIGEGVMGPTVEKLREVFFKTVRGEIPCYREWCTPVYSR